MAVAGIGTAIVLHRVLKRVNEILSPELIAARTLEAATIFAGVACLLTIASLRQAGTEADALVSAQILITSRDWMFLTGQGFIPAVNALLLAPLLYRARLVPRILPVLGLIGAALLLASAVATTAAPQHVPSADPGAGGELPLYRLHLLRAGCAFMGLGLMIFRVPDLFFHDEPWPLKEGVVVCILTAMALLALLGLRHPVKMLPILIFEVVWKPIWLTAVALPAVLADDVDPAMMEVVFSCAFAVIVVAVVPWGYVWRNYVMAKGDRWR